jgi:hypothetical protein
MSNANKFTDCGTISIEARQGDKRTAVIGSRWQWPIPASG